VRGAGGGRKDLLPASEQPAPTTLDRLAHEYSLKDQLDSTWAAWPIELVRDRGRTILLLEDLGGDLLSARVGMPIGVGPFLHIAVGVAATLGKVHQHGLIHKDIKPANILVNTASGEVRLTGFETASRLTRERSQTEDQKDRVGYDAFHRSNDGGRLVGEQEPWPPTMIAMNKNAATA
jgi:serine/threonine protein kinase